MNPLDRLARAAASSDEVTLTRRDLAAHGFLGLLALAVSSRVGAASVAFGATTPCTSLKTCLRKAESTAGGRGITIAFWLTTFLIAVYAIVIWVMATKPA